MDWQSGRVGGGVVFRASACVENVEGGVPRLAILAMLGDSYAYLHVLIARCSAGEELVRCFEGERCNGRS
jgi:hypothetical protein